MASFILLSGFEGFVPSAIASVADAV